MNSLEQKRCDFNNFNYLWLKLCEQKRCSFVTSSSTINKNNPKITATLLDHSGLHGSGGSVVIWALTSFTVTMTTPTFWKHLSGVMSGLSLGTRLPNLKFVKNFVSAAVLELLAFNAQNFLGSRDSSHAPFYPIFTFRGWRLPRHVVWSINHYNWSIDNVREAFQISHWKCITWVPIWGKIG